MKYFVIILILFLTGCSPTGNFKKAFFQSSIENQILNDVSASSFDPQFLYVKLFDVNYVEENNQAIPLDKLKQVAIDSSDYELVAGIRIGAETFRHKEKEEDYFEYLAHRAFGQMSKTWKKVKLGEIKRLYIQCDWTPEIETDVTLFCDTFTQFCNKLGIEVSIFMPKYYINSLDAAHSIHPDRWVIAYGSGDDQLRNGMQIDGSFPDHNFCKKVLADGAAVDVLFLGDDKDLKNAYKLPLPDGRMIIYK